MKMDGVEGVSGKGGRGEGRASRALMDPVTCQSQQHPDPPFTPQHAMQSLGQADSQVTSPPRLQQDGWETGHKVRGGTS